MTKKTLLGIDTGGTFTDFVCIPASAHQKEWRVHKVLSTPGQPQQAILKGIEDLGLTEAVKQGNVVLIHGTTVATNATLEGKGVRTAYITNRGLKDVLLIGRQTRPELYNLTPKFNRFPIDPELMLEVSARIGANGETVSDFEEGELEALEALVDKLKPESIAINLLFSFKNSAPEIELERRFADRYFVSRSSEILPEYREYERGVTTWVNGWIGPLIRSYLNALQEALAPAPVSIMQSNGLTISAAQAAYRAVNLLLSGPAGGLAAAQYIGKRTGKSRLMTFDMGGTSTDVALIEQHFTLTNTGTIAGMPIGVPMADIHTIGAGGGSVAYIDVGGLLRVGPESAGASPGPACYGNGGEKPTVTDANLILDRLSSARPLADGLQLNTEAATAAVGKLAEVLNQPIKLVAQGIIDIANEHMSQALRVISIQRGHDPRSFTLMCFGGAGGLHLCDLAESLEMTSAIVPIHGGVLSALGMLTAQPGRELARTLQKGTTEISLNELTSVLDSLADQGKRELADEGITEVDRRDSLDLRYQGQTFTLNLPFEGDLTTTANQFHNAHKRQYGHEMSRSVEILNGRVHLEATQIPPELPPLSLPAVKRDAVESKAVQVLSRENLRPGDRGVGPAIVTEDHSTTFIKSGWQFTVDKLGNLQLEVMTQYV
ncbi:MAG: N-methylhydantoinase A [Candidatus Azotimanducaceae bacterium]